MQEKQQQIVLSELQQCHLPPNSSVNKLTASYNVRISDPHGSDDVNVKIINNNAKFHHFKSSSHTTRCNEINSILFERSISVKMNVGCNVWFVKWMKLKLMIQSICCSQVQSKWFSAFMKLNSLCLRFCSTLERMSYGFGTTLGLLL